jgi:mono/diheme cytochrome c family protein
VVLNGKSQMQLWRDVLKADQIESIWAYILATTGPVSRASFRMPASCRLVLTSTKNEP